MGKNRLEAFSDGVIAIIITIMLLELKVPHGASLDALIPLAPVLLSYVLSFVYVAIYWNKLQYGCYPLLLKSVSIELLSRKPVFPYAVPVCESPTYPFTPRKCLYL
jgi:hypothetical protein